jgi:hypothetical protein
LGKSQAHPHQATTNGQKTTRKETSGQTHPSEEAREAEQQLTTEAAELLSPNLYIGNVTPGMKKRIEKRTGLSAKDIKGFTEKGFPTKRTKVPVTRGEAEIALSELETDLQTKLDNNQINTENDLALANARWGDIVELRKVLGLEKGIRPFSVRRADKHKSIWKEGGEILKAWKRVRDLQSRLDKAIKSGNKKQATSLEAQLIEAEEIYVQMEKALGHSLKTVSVKEGIAQAIRPTEESKLTVGEILRTTLRRQARAAKMAFAAGRRELRAQLRAKARAKKRLDAALKTIQKKIPDSVDFFYREAIEALRGDLDLKHRSKRQEATIRSRKDFLKRATEEERKLIPHKQIQQTGQKSLDDLTIGELEEISESIQRLIDQGKKKRKEMLKPELQQRKEDIAELTDNLEKVKAPRTKPGPQVTSVTKKSLSQKVFDIVLPLTWRPSRIFDYLDGRKQFKGAWHRIFYDNPKGAKRNEERMVFARKDAFLAKRKELGISLWDLAKSRAVYSPTIKKEVNYTVQELIGIYTLSKNKLSRAALNFGMNITDKDIESVITSMTDAEKALGDFLLEDYETNYPKLRRSVIEQENRDPGYQEFYSPIRRQDVNYRTLSAEFMDEVLYRDLLRKSAPAKGMTIERENIPPELQTKIRLDAVNIWENAIEKEARYIYRGPITRHMNKIMANRNLRKMLDDRFGKQMTEYISGDSGYISKFANPYIWRQFGDIEKISGRLRRNTAVAYLGFNLITMGKQLPSALLYLPDAGPSHLLASAIDFATNPMEMINKSRSLDPELKNRAIERELEEIKSTHNGNLIKQKMTEFGMEGIYLFDTVARTIGWNAVYQRALSEQNMSEGEAIRLARNATLRTQPAAAVEDLPALYTTNEFLNWFTLFTNQLNQIYNIATYDIPSYLINQQYAEAALGTFAMGMVALVIYSVTNRKIPDEPEEFAEALLDQSLSALPLVGRPIMSSRRGWSSDLPIFESVKGLYGAVDDLDFTRQDSREIAEAIAVITGIPYTAVRRSVQAFEEEQPTALLGARRPSGSTGKRRTTTRKSTARKTTTRK